MIIGLYYLTAMRDGFPGEGRMFIDFDDALNAYDARADLDLQAKIQVRLPYNTKVATAFGVFEDHKDCLLYTSANSNFAKGTPLQHGSARL